MSRKKKADRPSDPTELVPLLLREMAEAREGPARDVFQAGIEGSVAKPLFQKSGGSGLRSSISISISPVTTAQLAALCNEYGLNKGRVIEKLVHRAYTYMEEHRVDAAPGDDDSA